MQCATLELANNLTNVFGTADEETLLLQMMQTFNVTGIFQFVKGSAGTYF
jgi:hypothetical protein